MPAEKSEIQSLVQKMTHGDAAACGRLVTLAERMDERSDAVAAAIFERLGRAYRVGLTGPPGAGKSSLCLHLARLYRARDLKVGMVAVDPTSPISGGALLGDRIRMIDVATDAGVFIRSLASRGSFGGLSLAAGRVADVLDAFGCDVILYETVGMGQVGDDVRQQAETTVVVLVPESGDGVQVMKAGIIELADILVVNKSDRPGAGDLLRQLEKLPRAGQQTWKVPVLATSAQEGEGIAELAAAVDQHRAFVQQQPASADRRRFWVRRLSQLAENSIARSLRRSLADDSELEAEVDDVLSGRKSLDQVLGETIHRFYRRQTRS